MLCSVLANLQRDPKQRSQAWVPEDFLHHFDFERRWEDLAADDAELDARALATAERIFAAVGAARSPGAGTP